METRAAIARRRRGSVPVKSRQPNRGNRRLPARQSTLGLTLLVALAAAGGCDNIPPPPGTSAPPSSSMPNRGLVVFMGAGEGDPLWPILKTSAQRYEDSLGLIPIRYVNPAGRSPQDQIDCLRALHDPEMRGLCIHIIDVDAIRPILRKMYSRGVRIVSMIQPAPREVRAGHVGFDNRAIGTALAKATAKALDGAGAIALLHAGYEHPVYGPRRIAFEKELLLQPDIEVFTKRDCRTNPREARKIIREYSPRFPRLSAWVALDDWPLRDRGLDDLPIPRGCKFITFGGTPVQWPLIESGISAGIVAANYGELGTKAVLYCEAALSELPRFENRYYAPLRTLWATNLDEYKRDWTYWSTGKFPQAELEP